MLERLAVLERGSPEEIVLEQLRLREPADFQSLAGRAGLSAEETRAVVGALIESGGVVALDGPAAAAARIVPTTLLASRAGWERLTDGVRGQIEAYHGRSRCGVGCRRRSCGPGSAWTAGRSRGSSARLLARASSARPGRCWRCRTTRSA